MSVKKRLNELEEKAPKRPIREVLLLNEDSEGNYTDMDGNPANDKFEQHLKQLEEDNKRYGASDAVHFIIVEC